MAKGSSKSQYEAWLARIGAAGDSTPEHVRVRVRADYEARLKAVTEELKSHADSARQLIAQRKENLHELQKKEKSAAEKLAETELRHEVGEYDEGQWKQVHKDALAELGAVRDELMAIEREIVKLEELDGMVKSKPGAERRPAASGPRSSQVDELAFLKSVTEDAKNAPSPRRASGAQFQPVEPQNATPVAPAEDVEPVKTLKCRECGTMNTATEWYCENCGAELAAL
jgi:hypothetical protein